jgi:hypothetical protein
MAQNLKTPPVAMPKINPVARAAAANPSTTGKGVDSASSGVVTRAAASPSIAPFSIAAVSLGGWLWLEELPHQVVSRDQVHLIRAMVKALGLEEGDLAVHQFDWPIHNNAQLDLTQDAAYAALGGFVYSKVEKERCKGLMVLGAATLEKLDISQLGIKHCLTMLSTAAMLATPALKKQAWIELQQIVGLS